MFGLAVTGLGIEHFVFGTFVTGRAPAWLGSPHGVLTMAHLSGAIVVAAGLAIVVHRAGRPMALLLGAVLLIGAVLPHLPVVAGSGLFTPEWTRAGKALVLFGGAVAAAATFPPLTGNRRFLLVRIANERDGYLLIGRIVLGLFLILTGIQHFIYTEFVASLIPMWFPGNAVLWTRFAGVALLAGGTGLLVPWTAHWAALLAGAMVFSWVWIVHIPRTLATVSDGIAIFEALAVSGMAFVLWAAPQAQPSEPRAGRPLAAPHARRESHS